MVLVGDGHGLPAPRSSCGFPGVWLAAGLWADGLLGSGLGGEDAAAELLGFAGGAAEVEPLEVELDGEGDELAEGDGESDGDGLVEGDGLGEDFGFLL